MKLTCFFLETMEQLIDRHIWESVLLVKPLHSNQYAYQSGESAEIALNRLVLRVKSTIEQKEYALGIFLDTRGALNNTTIDGMCGALEERDVKAPIIRYFEIRAEYQRIEKKLVVGCPQGVYFLFFCGVSFWMNTCS